MSFDDAIQYEEYKNGMKNLEMSRITEGYEYVLRKLCHDGLPTNNYFELCSVYLLEFENMMKDKDIKNKPLKQLVFEAQEKEEKAATATVTANTKPRKSPSINKPIESNLSKLSPSNIIPKAKVNLKSKEFAVVNFNIEIDNNRAINNHRELFSENFELKSVKFNSHKIERKNLEILSSEKKDKKDMNNFIEQKDSELRILPSTLPEEVSYTNIPIESFEVNVDIVNHLSVSGNLEDFKYTIKNKNDKENSISLNRDELNIVDYEHINEYKLNSNEQLNDNLLSKRKVLEETNNLEKNIPNLNKPILVDEEVVVVVENQVMVEESKKEEQQVEEIKNKEDVNKEEEVKHQEQEPELEQEHEVQNKEDEVNQQLQEQKQEQEQEHEQEAVNNEEMNNEEENNQVDTQEKLFSTRKTNNDRDEDEDLNPNTIEQIPQKEVPDEEENKIEM